jgi:hypothetical protein
MFRRLLRRRAIGRGLVSSFMHTGVKQVTNTRDEIGLPERTPTQIRDDLLSAPRA